MKALYELEGDTRIVSNKELSDILEVSPPSVSEMIVKLQKDGYIEYTAYKGSRLTAKGREEAARMTRYHCLWEVFLVNCLHFRWSEAHIEAHNLEHHISPETADRLEAFLGMPRFSPHGTRIPTKDGTRRAVSQRPLTALSAGEEAHILYCREDMELMDYLQSTGIQMNMAIRLLRKEPYEGPIHLEARGVEYILSYKAASQVFVDSPEDAEEK